MLEGCSNHNCAIKGETGGMYTNGICNCVRAATKAESILSSRSWIEIDGRIVGPQTTRGNEIYIIRNWLKGGGLRDILALEQKESVESFPMEAVRHLSRASCRCQMSGPDVDANAHLDSCMVGQAQKYLGLKGTKIDLTSEVEKSGHEND